MSARDDGLTAEGRVALLLTVGFGLGALNTGTNLLYLVTAILAASLAVTARGARRAARGLEVAASAPARVTQGHALPVQVAVRAPAGLASPVVVRLHEGAAAGVLPLPAGGAAVATVGVRAPRRGRLRLAEARVVAGGPFGLVRRSRPVPLGVEALVVPPVRPLRPGTLRPARREADGRARRPTLAPEARDLVRGVREHRPGDDVRAIHWRASARRGALVVREFERPAPRDTIVVAHVASPPAGAPGAASQALADACASLGASVFAAALRAGDRAGLLLTAEAEAGDEAPGVLAPAAGPAALGRALDALALAAPAGEDALRRAARAACAWPAARLVVVTTADAARVRQAGGPLATAQVLAVHDPADLEALLAPAPAAGGP